MRGLSRGWGRARWGGWRHVRSGRRSGAEFAAAAKRGGTAGVAQARRGASEECCCAHCAHSRRGEWAVEENYSHLLPSIVVVTASEKALACSTTRI